MNQCGIICIGYDLSVLVLILEVDLDFYSMDMISMTLAGFLSLGFDVYGLVWVSTCCSNKEKDCSRKYFFIPPCVSHLVSQAGSRLNIAI